MLANDPVQEERVVTIENEDENFRKLLLISVIYTMPYSIPYTLGDIVLTSSKSIWYGLNVLYYELKLTSKIVLEIIF